MKYSFIRINFADVSLVIYDRYQKKLDDPNSIGFLDKNEVLALASDSGSIEFIPEPKNGFCSLRLCETQQYFVTLSDFATEQPENYSINIKSEFEATEISKGIYSFKVINYLGKADFEILSDGNIIHSVKLEIVPKKIDYEGDYVKLTEDIAEKCSTLLLDYSSPTNLSFKDNNETARTPLEKFIFIRTFCNNDNIESLFYSIKSNPDSLLFSEDELKSFGTASVSRKFFSNPFANSRNWTETENHSYLPELITTTRKYDSLDTPANRFLKFAFNSFIEVCDEVLEFLGDKNLTYKNEAEYIKENLELYLTESFFDDVQDLTSMPVNNQVLQKREGYSQIFNAFNMLDLAKQLDWKGENDVYEGQARNVALLYEYWLVFKFMEILKEIGAEIEFDLSDDDHKDRMFVKENGLLVSLKEGKTSYFSALTKDKKFRIKFYYNRTFGKKDFEGTDYQGSYSRDFRPDYTLAIFSAAYKEAQAIKLGEVSFIHFDAKYRVTDITSLFGKENLDSEDFSEQKKDETTNTYNRGDLLKMHTYNDAIRKTIGSYVLYPGTSNKENEFKVYDELLPGVGAFAIRPGDKKNVGAETLKKFISDIIEFKSKDSTRQYRKDYFENSIIRGPGDITSSKYSAVEKKDYVLCGMIRHDYLNHLKANHYIPLSEIDYGYKLKDPESRLYFYYHAIKDGAVYSLHPNTNDAKYFCGTVTDLGITSEVSLEKWTAEIEKSELVSAAQLIEALKKNSDYNLENPKADFYYLVTLKNIKWKGLPIADTEQKIEHDIRNLVGSPYSPKVFKLDKNM